MPLRGVDVGSQPGHASARLWHRPGRHRYVRSLTPGSGANKLGWG